MEAAFVIPKKELSSWEKWEFSSLDPLKSRKVAQDTKPVAQPEKQTIPEPEQDSSKQEAMTLPTAEQIEQIYQQAREEGKAAGHQEGMKQAKQLITTEAQRLRSLIDTLTQELQEMDQAVAQDLLALAIDLTKKMTNQALQIKPALILPIVEEAIRQLPAVSQPIRITLHPDDAAHIRTHLEDHPNHPKWHLQEDVQIEPGGCHVKLGGCEVDATLATRWQRTLTSLGQDQNWLE